MEENLQDETYVPKSLAEAHLFLDGYLVDKELFKTCPEDQVMGIAHMTLGRWIRNRWHLWWSEELRDRVLEKNENYPTEKPEIVQMFNDHGVMIADDMCGIIIMSYHAKLNDRPYDVHKEAQRVVDFYANKSSEEDIKQSNKSENN